MVASKFSLAATAVAALAPLASASAFDASSRSNLAVYYVRSNRSIHLPFLLLRADHSLVGSRS